jgi:hypothetical protein
VGGGESGERLQEGKLCCKYCIHMYINGKMIPVETVPGMGAGRIKENDRGGEFKCDIFGKL